MLASSSQGIKAALLRSSKEGGRRAVGEPTGGAKSSQPRHALLYYSSLVPSTDPTRALSRLHSLLLEGDLCAAWQQAAQRLRSGLQDARAACSDQLSGSRQAAAAATSPVQQQLEPLYGSNGVLRSAVMYVLAHASRGFMTRLNSTAVAGAQHMADALSREPGRALITVCNHVASMDDPLVMSTILPPAVFCDATALRWTLCASDRCFHRAALVPFFRAAKVLPVERDAGMFQPGLAAAEARLAAGDWVHIFPEGTRSRDGRMGPVRKGVGRLVAACARAGARPLILPFVHAGMEEVLPKGALLPKTQREVKVLVGEPIAVDDLLQAAAAQHWSDDALYAAIANRIGSRMAALQAALHGEPLNARAAAAAQQAALDAGLDLYDHADNSHRAATLWERVSFRAQHREWAVGGLAAAKARLAAAAAQAMQAAEVAPDGAALSAAPVLALMQRWHERQQRRRQGTTLATIKEWLLARGGSEAEDLSRQRSIGMMQLLQARV